MNGNKTNSVEIAGAVEELIELMRREPSVRDFKELSLGKNSLVVFTDESLVSRLFDPVPFLKAKQNLIREAIEDLSSGAPILMKSKMGIHLENLTPVPFTSHYEEDGAKRKILFQIGIRDAEHLRDLTGEFDFHEETANAAVYYLIHLLASEESAS